MTRDLDRAVDRWLRSERGERDRLAERALCRVFEALPLPAPGRSLLERTLAELGSAGAALPTVAGAGTRAWRIAFRFAATLVLALSGLAVALFAPVVVASFSLRTSLDSLVDVGAGVLTAVSRRLADGYVLWDVASRAGGTVADALATPQLFGWMLVILLLGSASLRFLASLVVVERSSYHA